MQREVLGRIVPDPIRRLPADLAAVIGLTVLTVLVVLLPGIRETPLRFLFGLPFVVFLPGYALVAALFPKAADSPEDEEADPDDTGTLFARSRGSQGIDGLERITLSFGLSIAIVPLLGFALTFTAWGIRLVPILVIVGGFTVVCSAIAAGRRWDLREEKRFRVPYGAWLAAARAELFDPDDRINAVVNVVLVLALLLMLSSVAYAVMVPSQGEQFTEIYLLTEDDDGELVADGYPEEFVQGESQPVIVGIENHEHETVDYTVVVQLERVEGDGGESEVVERDELDRFSTTLAHHETRHHDYEITPTMVGEDLRLTFLLYDGTVPDEPTRENAYRDLHLWIDVEEGDG